MVEVNGLRRHGDPFLLALTVVMTQVGFVGARRARLKVAICASTRRNRLVQGGKTSQTTSLKFYSLPLSPFLFNLSGSDHLPPMFVSHSGMEPS